MNNLDKQYLELLQDILDNGIEKGDRTGTGTISVFGRQIRHNMSEGFPLLTTKKMAWNSIVVELLWFLRGDTNIKYLVDNGCNIWNGDVYKNYIKYCSVNDSKWDEWMRDNGDDTLSMYTIKEFIEMVKRDNKFAKKWGDLGPIYGAQWRKWRTNEVILRKKLTKKEDIALVQKTSVDQIKELIKDLNENPDSRRMMVSAWNPADLPVTDYRTDDELYNNYLKYFE